MKHGIDTTYHVTLRYRHLDQMLYTEQCRGWYSAANTRKSRKLYRVVCRYTYVMHSDGILYRIT